MTEAEWLECKCYSDLLQFWGHRVSDRKLRLFACACCRRDWPCLALAPICREAIAAGERYAEGVIEEAERKRIWDAALYFATTPALWPRNGEGGGEYLAATVSLMAPGEEVWDVYSGRSLRRCFDGFRHAVAVACWCAQSTEPEPRPPRRKLSIWRKILRRTKAVFEIGGPNWDDFDAHPHSASLLREIVGNPFRPITIDGSWLQSGGGTVNHLAQGIYEDRRFTDLPILADALEEAGCTHEELLDHCREPSEHVRGCWALDLVLAKG